MKREPFNQWWNDTTRPIKVRGNKPTGMHSWFAELDEVLKGTGWIVSFVSKDEIQLWSLHDWETTHTIRLKKNWTRRQRLQHLAVTVKFLPC